MLTRSGIRRRCVAVVAATMCMLPVAAQAWSRDSQLAIAEAARKVAPPDLNRQIERHKAAFQAGIKSAPALSRDGVRVEELVDDQAQRTVKLIRSHAPFESIVEQFGRVAYWVAYANNPYHAAGRTRNYRDFLSYVDSARPRFRPVFYGLIQELEDGGTISALIQRAGRRGRGYQPLIEGEYRRVNGPPGSRKFDDRSTAFGITAVAYSHAVTDVGLAMRSIWLQAGGDDRRPLSVRSGNR